MSKFQKQLPSFAKETGSSGLPGRGGGYTSSTFFTGTGDAVNETSQSRGLQLHVLGRVLAMMLFLWPIGLAAQSSRRSNSVVVVPSSWLPEDAQSPSESMFLHPNNDGTTYLYLEQHSKNHLVVLDVTHPIHISQVSVVQFEGAAFDFVRALGSSSALICFRDNSGSGVVQFRQPKQPLLIAAPELKQASRTEDIGAFGLLVTNSPRTTNDVPEHDIQIVDLSPNKPTVLATAHRVHQQIEDSSTGAHFLLGADGLTVVRQPDVESQNEIAQKSTN
ncbi:hypothetical protein [Granulicella rosea]|nr:hypothetical protein [Granulicella rosea]